jgi:phosphotransferase family enzyme
MAMGPAAQGFVVTGSRGSPRPVRHNRAMGTEPTTGLEPSELLVTRVEETLGERTTAWSRVTRSGYSSVERWIVGLSDNETVFVKSSGDPLLASFLRDEHHIYANLRGSFLPRLVAWSDGDQPVLVLEALTDAHWPPPWTETSIEKALSTLDEIAAAPVPDGLPIAADEYVQSDSWEAVVTDRAPFLSLGLCSEDWLQDHLAELAEASLAAPIAGNHLVHCDFRSDNLCIRGDGAVVVDWNWACVGNSDFDAAFWVPSLAMELHRWPKEIPEHRPGVQEFASYVAGFFASRAGLPPPETAPYVRAFQLAQLRVAFRWAVEALDLPSPPASYV